MIDRLIVILPGITMALYAIVAIAFASKREWAWAVVYIGYALANVGLIIASFPKGTP